MESELTTVNKLVVSGQYTPNYAVVLNHEGYSAVRAAPIAINFWNRDLTIDHRTAYSISGKHSSGINFAIRKLKRPFLVIPGDMISNSEYHRVVGPSRVLDYSLTLFTIRKEYIFPTPRPQVKDLENVYDPHVAWIVSVDEVMRMWTLNEVDFTDTMRIGMPSENVFKKIQGNLEAIHVTEDNVSDDLIYSLPMRKCVKVFNHELNHVYAVTFTFNGAVYAVVHNYNNIEIHSRDHETVSLNGGTYVLRHTFPDSDVD